MFNAVKRILGHEDTSKPPITGLQHSEEKESSQEELSPSPSPPLQFREPPVTSNPNDHPIHQVNASGEYCSAEPRLQPPPTSQQTHGYWAQQSARPNVAQENANFNQMPALLPPNQHPPSQQGFAGWAHTGYPLQPPPVPPHWQHFPQPGAWGNFGVYPQQAYPQYPINYSYQPLGWNYPPIQPPYLQQANPFPPPHPSTYHSNWMPSMLPPPTSMEAGNHFNDTQPVPALPASHPNNPTPEQVEYEDSDAEDAGPMHEWKQGRYYVQYRAAEAPKDWRKTSWAMRSQGEVARRDRLVEVRRCLGVFECTTCKAEVRPLTQADSRERQLSETCKQIVHGRACGGRIALQRSRPEPEPPECTVHQFIGKWREKDDNGKEVDWESFEIIGKHRHSRPPRTSRMSSKKKAAIDEQVSRRREASAHALRTGDLAPGSVPLGEIDPKLNDPRVARYEVAKSQERQGIAGRFSKGSSFSLDVFKELSNKLPGPFLVESQVHGPIYIIMQSDFMRQVLYNSLEAYIASLQDGEESARHGFVTDGDHSGIDKGVVLTTVVFDLTLQAWVPIQWTYILGLDIAHHRPHFKYHFRQVKDRAGSGFHKSMLHHTMDFSQAELASHAEEYADIMMETVFQPGVSVDVAVQNAQRVVFLDDAKKSQSGCETHFLRSCNRIHQTSSIVSTDKQAKFMSLIFSLLRNNSYDNFCKVRDELQVSFPKAKNWLDWWMRPGISTILFPACKDKAGTENAHLFPKTTNPVEHQHSLAHHGTGGKGYGLIEGIQKLYLHVSELERRYNAIKGGHITADPADKRAKRPKKKVVFQPGDDRAPDRADILDRMEKSGTLEIPRLLKGYKWVNNSCSIDAGLEFWFRSFYMWPVEQRDKFLTEIPASAPGLAELFSWFSRRLKWIFRILDGENSWEQGLEILKNSQIHARKLICETWDLWNIGDYGDTITWLSKGLWLNRESPLIQEFFSVRHSVTWICPSHPDAPGNQSVPSLIRLRSLKIHECDRGIGSKSTDNYDLRSPATLDEYFAHYIPRYSNIEEQDFTKVNFAAVDNGEPLNLQARPKCAVEGCSNVYSVDLLKSVMIDWPFTLAIEQPWTVEGSHQPVTMSVSFSIQSDDDRSPVTYKLVSRLVYMPNHYVIDSLLPNAPNGELHTFRYDDIRHDGGLTMRGNVDEIFEKPTSGHVLTYSYVRTSENQQTIRDAAKLMDDVVISNQIAKDYKPPEIDFTAENSSESAKSKTKSSMGHQSTVDNVPVKDAAKKASVKADDVSASGPSSRSLFGRPFAGLRTRLGTQNGSVANSVKRSDDPFDGMDLGPVLNSHNLLLQRKRPFESESESSSDMNWITGDTELIPTRASRRNAKRKRLSSPPDPTQDSKSPAAVKSSTPPILRIEKDVELSLQRVRERSRSPFSIDCAGCGLSEDGYQSKVDDSGIVCASCGQWSHKSCLALHYGIRHPLDDNDPFDSPEWKCPQCSDNIRKLNSKDAKTIGEYFLMMPPPELKVKGSSAQKYWLAELRTIDGLNVTLQWNDLNKFPKTSGLVAGHRFLSTPSECVKSRTMCHLDEFKKKFTGGIQLPVAMLEDATSSHLGYSNNAIQHALMDSKFAILDILARRVQHPIMDLVESYAKHRGVPLAQGQADGAHLWPLSDFPTRYFSYYVLPGDHSIAANLFSEWLRDEQYLEHIDARSPVRQRAGLVLIDLVILRVYMNLSPAHDLELYYLSRVYPTPPNEPFDPVRGPLPGTSDIDEFRNAQRGRLSSSINLLRSLAAYASFGADCARSNQWGTLITRLRNVVKIDFTKEASKSLLRTKPFNSDQQPYIWEGGDDTRLQLTGLSVIAENKPVPSQTNQTQKPYPRARPKTQSKPVNDVNDGEDKVDLGHENRGRGRGRGTRRGRGGK